MRPAVLATVLGAATALASPLPALAAGPTPPPTPAPPAPAPAPAPQPGKMSMQVLSKMTVHRRSYVLMGDVATVVGRVAPYVAGQVVRVRISTPGHKPAVALAKIAAGGTFKTRFRTRRAVTYTVYARHDATEQQAVFAAKTGATAVTPGKGMAVVLLKQGLRALGYPAGNGPVPTTKLERSVLAFRKTNGMARIYRADRAVYEMVFAGRGAFPLRYPRAGKHVEADLSRQVVVLADNGRPVATYPTSSGKPSTPTVLGHFHFYTKAPGTNAKGMYMSNYFIRGYAIHGYPEVPTYAASHGCLRIANADAVAIFNQIDIGESIWVYP
jgi:lipoprotein-anchoring transpeptidase ErfK/SrfK